ncbi:alkyl sulfatase dimerization domain-containing protein [Blastococcus goldschmidtiae]|uniref:Alkyl sulfatase dimerization domain-containing protein n=1 Tax=Blastococcus goldschmidtiae TaxID=3075546 RepID=A0ABU2K6V9_9ACTN|nr:alkyl sulfatase dimerization domain-containing protein [Blastococcus sp. DSM 46792]MDT0275924.1 alkyl sulfatase dimerization domain-containing protein [Blastococcus sp. DSM 46792]
MPDLLDLSARMIDTGVVDGPTNRVTQELSEVAEGVAVIESFSHVLLFETDEGLVAFDSSGAPSAGAVVSALRGWRADPVHTLIYTHGHVDHVGGSGALVADAAERGHRRPRVVAHENVPARFGRYVRTDGYNRVINRRQFGWLSDPNLRIADAGGSGLAPGPGQQPARFLPEDVARPDVTYTDHLDLSVGGLDIRLHHARGETDDHTWAWIPHHRAVCAGDFFIWNFPNAGNPQKVQRYPAEWAAALRAMAAQQPELFLPAHGLPIAGRERIAGVLGEVADVLEALVEQTVALMNDGATLDAVLQTVSVPDATLARPFLRPLYDEPEFVVRNIWRLYGGWYDGNPARLKPPADSHLAAEVAALAGGARALAVRAEEVAANGDLRLAAQLVEWAVQADPVDAGLHAVRSRIYRLRRNAEQSLMARGIFTSAAAESEVHAEG